VEIYYEMLYNTFLLGQANYQESCFKVKLM